MSKNIVYLSERLCQTTPPHELPNLMEVEEIMEAMPEFPKCLYKDAIPCDSEKDNVRRTFDEYQYQTPDSSYTITFLYHAMGIIITKVVKA